MNPFTKDSGNEDIFRGIRKWSHENLEGLTIKKMAIKMSEMLVPIMNADTSFQIMYSFKFPFPLPTVLH